MNGKELNNRIVALPAGVREWVSKLPREAKERELLVAEANLARIAAWSSN